MPYDGSIWSFLLNGIYNAKYLFFMLSIYSLIALWAIFDKAYEPGWGALVPIYNSYLYFKITWGKGWYFILMLIPIANVVIAIITTFKLARAFGKGFWFGLGLLFLGAVFMGILAFGEASYYGVPEKDDSFDL